MRILLKNAKRLMENGVLESCDVLIEEGKIKQIGESIEKEDVDRLINCEVSL